MAKATHDELARLQEEFDRNPESRLFVHLAEAHRQSGDLDRAREVLLQGLERHPDFVSARIVLAQVERERGELEAAREGWEQVVRMDEENELALWELAELEAADGRRSQALEYYHRLAALGVDDERIQYRLRELEDGPEVVEATLVAEPAPAAGMEDHTPTNRARTATSAGGSQEMQASQAAAEVRSGNAPAEEQAPRVIRRAEPAPVPAQTDAIGLSDLLVRLLEYRDSTFCATSSLTRLLALSIGEELELDRGHLDALALAALLSDLGGTALAAKNGGAGSADAARLAEQREVAISLQFLQGIALPAGVHEAIRHQHERWDGSGYPDGLRDEEIPYTARVLSVSRAAAELLTGNGEVQRLSVAETLDELQREAGEHFDPVIVSVLRRVFQQRADHGIGYGVGGRVIIVHHEELRALGLATQLHSNGYVSEMTGDTGRVRTRLRSHPTEALVLGAQVPGSDMGRFIREVRNNPTVAGIPIVVIDANDIDLRVDLLTAGADVCFPSDVNFKEFKATLDALLRRREENGGPALV